MNRVAVLLILAGVRMFGAPPLEVVSDTADRVYTNLKSFVCEEHVDRFRNGKALDQVDASLSFENGEEQYSHIRQNGAARPSMSSLSGAWSEGEFGSLLRQTSELLKSVSVTAQQDGSYSFDVDESSSPWDLAVGGREYRIAFRTVITINPGAIQIVRHSLRLPQSSGIRQLDWAVTLQQTKVNGDWWYLPSSAEYMVTYSARHVEMNRLQFRNYRRYAAEVALRFGAE